MNRRLRILTWHIHGNYLYYLSQAPHDFFVPTKPDRPTGYGGRCGTLPWPSNLHEVPAAEVHRLAFDCILYQSHANYLHDQYEILSEQQRRLPRIFLEHDPPRETPTDTRHPVDDPSVLLVHVTHYNRLMWNSGRTPSQVIEHGVTVPQGVRYCGDRRRGVFVANGLPSRGRRLGADIFEECRRWVPLDLIGIDSEALGGLGEVQYHELPGCLARYRFFFNGIRYTSLPLSLCEAMMIGMPIVALATTEIAKVVEHGVAGYTDTNLEQLIADMRDLLDDPAEAYRLSEGARRIAQERFSIDRFIRDWDDALALVTGHAKVRADRRQRRAPSQQAAG